MLCEVIDKGDKYIFKCSFNSGEIEVHKKCIQEALAYLKDLRETVAPNCTSHIYDGIMITHNHVYKQHIDYAIGILSERDYVEPELLKDVKGNKEKLLRISVCTLKTTYDMIKKGKYNE